LIWAAAANEEYSAASIGRKACIVKRAGNVKKASSGLRHGVKIWQMWKAPVLYRKHMRT